MHPGGGKFAHPLAGAASGGEQFGDDFLQEHDGEAFGDGFGDDRKRGGAGASLIQ